MKKLKTFLKTKLDWDNRVDCDQMLEECAGRSLESANRRIKWEADISGNVEIMEVGQAVQDEMKERFKSEYRIQGCFKRCPSWGGQILGKGNPDKCPLMPSSP
jgi:hypothetical protein